MTLTDNLQKFFFNKRYKQKQKQQGEEVEEGKEKKSEGWVREQEVKR